MRLTTDNKKTQGLRLTTDLWPAREVSDMLQRQVEQNAEQSRAEMQRIRTEA